jgi:hypothetical protein
MFDRVNIFALLRGHWKGLRDRDGAEDLGPDLVARGVLLGSATIVLLASWHYGLQLRQPGIMFAGLSLLSSGLLAAFAQIASIRARFQAPEDAEFDTDLDTRNMLDEAVAHVLTAAMLAAIDAALILVALNVGGLHNVAPKGAPVDERIATGFSVPIAAIATYMLVLFVMAIRKLYAAYVQGNEVDPAVSGHHRVT